MPTTEQEATLMTKAVGFIIKAIRKSKGITQTEFAEMMGKGQSTAVHWEHDASTMNMKDLFGFINKNGLKVSKVFELAENLIELSKDELKTIFSEERVLAERVQNLEVIGKATQLLSEAGFSVTDRALMGTIKRANPQKFESNIQKGQLSDKIAKCLTDAGIPTEPRFVSMHLKILAPDNVKGLTK